MIGVNIADKMSTIKWAWSIPKLELLLAINGISDPLLKLILSRSDPPPRLITNPDNNNAMHRREDHSEHSTVHLHTA